MSALLIFDKKIKKNLNNLRPLIMSAPKTAKRLRFEGAGKKVHEKELDNEVMNRIF